MALVIPPAIDAEGAVKVFFVPALADPAHPTLAELSGAGSLEISCYLTKDGFGISADDDKSTDERLCTKEVYEVLGRAKWQIENLVYIWDPQGSAASVSNKAYAAMKRGTQGYLVVRWGKDVELALAVADIVDVFPVTLGTQIPQKPEANSKLKVEQSVIVSGKVQRDKALVA